MREMEESAIKSMLNEGIPREKMIVKASLDMCYLGQLHEINIPINSTTVAGEVLEEAKGSFTKKYEGLYGFSESLPLQVVTLRIDGIGEVPTAVLRRCEAGPRDASEAVKGTRDAYFGKGYTPTTVYDGLKIKCGNEVAGPAIVEYPTTVLVIQPGQKARWDEYLNAIIE